MIEVSTFLKELRKTESSTLADVQTKKYLYTVTREVLKEYLEWIGDHFTVAKLLQKEKILEHTLAFLRAQDERYHSKQIASFMLSLSDSKHSLYKEYKFALSQVNKFNFQSHPIAHMRYGVKTALSFFWKMSYLVVENPDLTLDELVKTANQVASVSLLALLDLDGFFWDRLQFQIPSKLTVSNGRLYVLEPPQLRIRPFNYPPLGCPALKVRDENSRCSLIRLLGEHIFEFARNKLANSKATSQGSKILIF